MNYHRQIDVEEARRREAERRALHSLALENIELDADTLALREKVMSGEITEAEYRTQIIANVAGSGN